MDEAEYEEQRYHDEKYAERDKLREQCATLIKANRELADRAIAAEAKLRLTRGVCSEVIPVLKCHIKDGCECDDDWCRCGIGNVRRLIGLLEALSR
jgi:hypothetical protein